MNDSESPCDSSLAYDVKMDALAQIPYSLRHLMRVTPSYTGRRMLSIRLSFLQKSLNFLRALPFSVQYGRTFSGSPGLASVEMVIPRAKTGVDRISDQQRINACKVSRETHTVVAHDDSVWGKQALVQDALDIALIALFVGVHEDQVEGACKGQNRLARVAFDESHSIVEPISIEGPSRGRNHLWVQLQRDDLGLGVLRALIPSQSTVSCVAADLQDY